MWIAPFDQIDFPGALPFLDLAFTQQSGLKRLVNLKPDEAVNTVFRCKAGDGSGFMF